MEGRFFQKFYYIRCRENWHGIFSYHCLPPKQSLDPFETFSFFNVILHVKIKSQYKQKKSCLYCDFIFTRRFTLKKRKNLKWIQSLFRGVDNGMKRCHANFHNILCSKTFEKTSLPFRGFHYYPHCIYSKNDFKNIFIQGKF